MAPAPLSARARELLLISVSEQSEALAAEALEQIKRRIPEYACIQNPSVFAEAGEMIVTTLRACALELVEQRMPGPAALAETITLVRRRVHQGIPLHAILQAYRIGVRLTWDSALEHARSEPALREELLFKVSPLFMDIGDLLAQMLTATYAEEVEHRGRWRERVQAELVELVFNTPENVDGFRERCRSLGIDPEARHTAFALQGDEDATRFGHNFLRARRNGVLIVWSASSDVVMTSTRGVGLPDVGPAGFRQSAEQALAALELGSKLLPGRSVFQYADVALEHAVLSSPVLTQLLQDQLAQLEARPMLLETLQAWVDHGPHRKAVATALDIHPNSLAYRLECVGEILGAPLDDLRQLPRLQLALRLRQLNSAFAPSSS